jgi:hypothetical protein
MILCDGCGTDGQTCFSCANVTKAPEGSWYCTKECANASKEIPPPPHRKRTSRDDEKVALFDYLISEHKAMKAAVATNKKYARIETLSKQQQDKQALAASIVELDTAASKSNVPRPVSEYAKRLQMAEEFHQMPDVSAEIAALKVGLVFPKPDMRAAAQVHMDNINATLDKHSQ